MESLTGIEDRKCFLIHLPTGEQNAVVESVRELLDHLFVIDTISAAEKVRGLTLEQVFVNFKTELGRDGHESAFLWFGKGGWLVSGKGGVSDLIFAWKE